MAEHPVPWRLVVTVPLQGVRREPFEPHGWWCRGILRQGMPRATAPSRLRGLCGNVTLPSRTPHPRYRPVRALCGRAVHGERGIPAGRQPASPAGFAAGQELRRRPPRQPSRTSRLPCGSGNGQPGREERRRARSKLLHIHGCGKMWENDHPLVAGARRGSEQWNGAWGAGGVGSPWLCPGW